MIKITTFLSLKTTGINQVAFISEEYLLYLILTSGCHFGTKYSSIVATSSRLHHGLFLRSIIVFPAHSLVITLFIAQEKSLATHSQKIEILI